MMATATNFSEAASAALGGPTWLVDRRRSSFGRLAELTPPSTDAEVWRYTPIDRFDLDAYAPVFNGTSRGADVPAAVAAEFGGGAVVVFVNGHPVSLDRADLPDSVTFAPLSSLASAPTELGAGIDADDLFVTLGDAFGADGVVLDVPTRTTLNRPVLILHWCDASAQTPAAPALFPRSVVSVGAEADVQVIEVVIGPNRSSASLVAPVGELSVGDGGRLSYAAVQALGDTAWHLSRISARVGRDAALRTFTAGLGASYDRCRLDSVAAGQGATTDITSVYLGADEQVHDVRTLQDHAAPRTRSDLLCQGAVAGNSRSVYSGLIRMRHGATRSEAMQTNHNLVLDPGAHADSVPNLDIQENDVRCSHASSVGPIDEDQRYYLESRGVPPERAERLIVLGFFDDVLGRIPVAQAAGPIRRRITERLAASLPDPSAEDR
jgi:Fe-S cluster assembly protein SufD